MHYKFTLKLYNRETIDFYFRSGLIVFIIEYTKKAYLTCMKILLQTQENINIDFYNKRQM